jgi:threonine dehydrogenase-like Zn-dependent dehydrogenase
MVLGLGLLGLFAVQAAKLAGGIPVIVADFDSERRALALILGADHAFAPDEPDLPAKVRELTGGGVNAVVEVTGAAAALQLALDCVAREGRIALTGCTRISDVPIDFYRQVHVPGVSLIGAHNQVRPAAESRPGYWTELDDYRALLRLLSAGRLQTRPLITQVVSPAQAPEVYRRLADNPLAPLGVAFDWAQVRTP